MTPGGGAGDCWTPGTLLVTSVLHTGSPGGGAGVYCSLGHSTVHSVHCSVIYLPLAAPRLHPFLRAEHDDGRRGQLLCRGAGQGHVHQALHQGPQQGTLYTIQRHVQYSAVQYSTSGSTPVSSTRYTIHYTRACTVQYTRLYTRVLNKVQPNLEQSPFTCIQPCTLHPSNESS